MKALGLIVLAIASLALPACKTLDDVSEEDLARAKAFAGCVAGCASATQANPELLQP